MAQGAPLALPDPGAECLGMFPAASLTVFPGLPLPGCSARLGRIMCKVERGEAVPEGRCGLLVAPGVVTAVAAACGQELALPGRGGPVTHLRAVTRQPGGPLPETHTRHGSRSAPASRDSGRGA